jgi:HSP20 family protein
MREMMSVGDLMGQAFDDFFSRSTSTIDRYVVLDLDMAETEDDVVVQAAIPGVKPDEINISVSGDTLTIRGEVKEDDELEENNYHIREMRRGSVTRSVLLPSKVIADKAKAEFENGILKLTLPKAEEVKPKTISVKAK